MPQIDLLTGMNGRRGRGGEFAVGLRIDPRDIVAGQHVLEPHQVVFLDRAGETYGVVEEPTRAAIERQADPVAKHFLHGDDAVEHVVEAALADLPLVHGAVIAGAGLPGAIVEVVDGVLHVGVEADALLDHEEVLRLLHHPLDVCGIVFGPVAGPLLADRAVIDADPVAHLAAEQLVGGHIGRLAGNVP